MIKHIVMWTIKDSVDGKTKEQNILRLKVMLDNLKKKIPVIKALEVGVNYNSSPAAFDLVLYTAFKDKKELAIYQDHPDHVKVKEFIATIVDKRAVVDYEV